MLHLDKEKAHVPVEEEDLMRSTVWVGLAGGEVAAGADSGRGNQNAIFASSSSVGAPP